MFEMLHRAQVYVFFWMALNPQVSPIEGKDTLFAHNAFLSLLDFGKYSSFSSHFLFERHFE